MAQIPTLGAALWTAASTAPRPSNWRGPYLRQPAPPDPWGANFLAVTEARWQELVGQPSLKGIKGSPIPIIAADTVGHPSKYIPRSRAKRAW